MDPRCDLNKLVGKSWWLQEVPMIFNIPLHDPYLLPVMLQVFHGVVLLVEAAVEVINRILLNDFVDFLLFKTVVELGVVPSQAPATR